MRRAPALAAVAVAAVVASSALWPVGAGATEGPTATVDRQEAAPGEPLVVTLRGFEGDSVTVAVCGNLAKRGSSDCNMPAAQSEGIRHDRVATLTQLFVQPPPMPCPCLVRASTASNDEFAVAPITVLGHPVGPVVDTERGPLGEVDVDVGPAGSGLLAAVRSALGGPTPYELTVRVRNITTEPLSNVALTGSARHRFDDNAATLRFDAPGTIEPGQTWEQRVEAEVGAPVLGRCRWQVAAAGAGSAVVVEQAVSHVPVALLVALVLLLVDVVVITVRIVVRRRRRRRADELPDDVDGVHGAGGSPASFTGPLPIAHRDETLAAYRRA